MTASVRVIFSGRAAWAVANNADVVENVRTASMMARKSRADIEICCDGGAVMLGPTTSVGAEEVLGDEGSGGAEDVGVVGNGVVVAGAGTEDAGT